MNKNKLANLLSWFAALVAGTCLIGLLAAIVIALAPSMFAGELSGFVFLVLTTWLVFLGIGTILTAGLATTYASGEASSSQTTRSRYSLLIGFVSLAVGLMYGVAFS